MTATTASVQTPELERLEARETVYRLSAALFGYPLEETQQALEDGRLRKALAPVWQKLTGRPWPTLPASEDLTALQVGYTATFLQGRRKPRVPLVGSGYADILNGQAQGSYLLNVQAFYRHFGLQAAQGDEGHTEEPDHIVAMLEFCTLLCHLERRALTAGQEPGSLRRAQRDFIARYLGPLADEIRDAYSREQGQGLDPTLAYLVAALPDLIADHLEELSARVGPCPPPGTSDQTATDASSMWD